MTTVSYTSLPNRGVLWIEGEDHLTFLQGLISNDVNKITDKEAIYAAFLTPQGKFLCDFFIIQAQGGLLLDIDKDALATFKKKLTMFKLRSKVSIKDISEDYTVMVAFGGTINQEGVFKDPRLESAGYRAILANGKTIEAANEVSFDEYDLHRIKLGLPDGARDMKVDKSILLENGFDELNGVDWDKGCYMGQELTARTKYRALIKKRLFPVAIDGVLPAPGTDVLSDDKVVGEIHSGIGQHALATLKLHAIEAELKAGSAKITPLRPAWMVIPE